MVFKKNLQEFDRLLPCILDLPDLGCCLGILHYIKLCLDLECLFKAEVWNDEIVLPSFSKGLKPPCHFE
jgi:hypothetical protein